MLDDAAVSYVPARWVIRNAGVRGMSPRGGVTKTMKLLTTRIVRVPLPVVLLGCRTTCLPLALLLVQRAVVIKVGLCAVVADFVGQDDHERL